MTMVKTINFNDKFFDISYVLQPIISRDGELSFFEILGRVKDKNAGLMAVNPQIAANYTKMLIEYAYNLTAMNYFPNSKLSLNISHTEINADIVDMLLQLFFKRELANRVMIEVTEDVLITSNIAELLIKLKNNGFIIAFDDFCSEKSVRDLIVNYDFIDVIKFDGFFMTHIQNGKDELIDGLSHLNSFAKSLGKKTVVEHIENKMLLDVTRNIGADYFQGFYLGKPHSIEYYKGKEKVFGTLHCSQNLILK
ncbi:MAG: EAL domain-containing protein [Aliarcobacter cryaerophilus]|nr:EAL domain-containing protein [Aliarcobacter cryaerophilus]